jgi:PAS domain S-box-containing protein
MSAARAEDSGAVSSPQVRAPAGWPLAAIAAVLIVAAVTTWRVIREERHHVEESWETRLSLIVANRETGIQSWLHDRRADATVIAQFPTVHELLGGAAAAPARDVSAGSRTHLESVLNSFLAAYGYDAIALVDRQGQVVLSRGDAPPAALATHVARTLRVDELVRPHGGPWIRVTVPVTPLGSSGDEPVGALTFLMNPAQSLWPMVGGNMAAISGVETYLLRVREGVVTLLSPLADDGGRVPQELAASREASIGHAAAAGTQGFGEFVDPRGVPVLATIRRIEPMGWILVSQVERRRAFRPFWQDAWQTAAVGTLVVLAFAAFVVSVRRRQRARELTVQLKRERALRDAQERYRSLIENSQDMIVTLDAEGVVRYASPSHKRVLGYDPQEIVGHAAFEFVHADDVGAVRQGFLDIVRRGSQAVASREVRFRHKNGSWRILEATVHNLLDDPTMRGVVLNSRDVTDRKLADEEVRRLNVELEQRVRARTAELEAANADLEAFNYSVSHDLRAPLRHVEGFTRILQADYGADFPPEVQHYLERIAGAAQRMSQLIEALLELSRVGRTTPQVRPVDLGALVRAALDELRPRDDARPIEFVLGALPMVSGDPRLLRQLFDNLLDNAIKFTRDMPAPRIEVGSEQHNGDLVVFVRDNGVGFDPQYAARLFHVFHRLHSAEQFEGTGVGLSIVKRITEKHGGRVWASATPGRGATFYCSLPR